MRTEPLHAGRPADLVRAANLLNQGELVAIPTETVYGLAANALDPVAVGKIFLAKGRPQDNPLIVHVDCFKKIQDLVEVDSKKFQEIQVLGEFFWPGPLTLVLHKSQKIPDLVSAGLPTVALRIPTHEVALSILRGCGLPLAAPSANRSGKPSPTTAAHVFQDLDGLIAAIVDGGASEVGIESTVLSLVGDEPLLLRPGAVLPEEIEDVLHKSVSISPAILEESTKNDPLPSPGMRYRHYAPSSDVKLICGTTDFFVQSLQNIKPDTAVCFEEEYSTLKEKFCQINWIVLGGVGNHCQQAATLFSSLREIDEKNSNKACIHAPAPTGMGLALYNRLLRACAFQVVREHE